MPRSSEWSLTFRFSNHNFQALLISPIRASCPAHVILLDHNNIWWSV